MKVSFIASGRDVDCGINTYTTELEEALPIEFERFGTKSYSLDVLDYAEAALGAVRSDGDVIHLQHEYGLFGPATLSSWAVILILLVGKLVTGKACVLTLHTAWDRETPDPPLIPLKRFYIWVNNHLLLALADHVVFLSENTRDRMTAAYDVADWTLLPHGVQVSGEDVDRETARERMGWDPEESVVVQPGYIRPQKGYRTFIEVARACPERTFVVAGGVRNEEFRPYAEEVLADRPPNVEHTGVLDDEAFHAVFAGADLCFLPYEEATQSGIVNWAFAYDLPVFGSGIEYFQEMAEKTEAVRSLEGGPQAIAEAINAFFADPEEQKAMEESVARYRERNSMTRVAEDHVEIYESVT